MQSKVAAAGRRGAYRIPYECLLIVLRTLNVRVKHLLSCGVRSTDVTQEIVSLSLSLSHHDLFYVEATYVNKAAASLSTC